MPPLPAGKLPAQLLASLLGGSTPLPSEVLLGPAVGEDACALRVGGAILVAATDPITFASRRAGRLSVIVNANDVAVMGAAPRWFLAAVLLPVGTEAPDVANVFADLRRELEVVGAALVGGHTEITPAVAHPVIVGQMLGVATGGRVVPTGAVRPGDMIVQVGPVPVEGAAVLAIEAAEQLSGVDPAIVQAAAGALDDPGISVVAPALAAADLGATAMHDPTEGGLAGGLHEMAAASGVALRVDTTKVQWFEPGLAVCRALGADPWATLASGSLLAAFASADAGSRVRRLSSAGWPATVIATAEAGRGIRDQEGRAVPWPERDEVARLLSSASSASER